MKKLLTCLLFCTVFKTVISASDVRCGTLDEATITRVKMIGQNDLIEAKKIQSEINPFDLFDLRFR